MSRGASKPKKQDAPLFVEQYDNPLRYLVRSEEHSDISYLVEIGNKNYPHGRCDCDDYRFRIEPAVIRKQVPECGRYVCKHIIAVVDHCTKKSGRSSRTARRPQS